MWGEGWREFVERVCGREMKGYVGYVEEVRNGNEGVWRVCGGG